MCSISSRPRSCRPLSSRRYEKPRTRNWVEPMLITYRGKRVGVAGAAWGIGHALAVAFAENGGEVTACDRLVEEVEHFAGPAKSGGGTIHAARVDVTDKASVEAVVARIGSPIDVLVYVAG